MFRIRPTVPFAMVLLIAACHDGTAPRAPTSNLTLDLRLSATSGGPGEAIVATAVTSNTGTVPLLYNVPCPYIHVLSPEGVPLLLFDPTRELMPCPEFLAFPANSQSTVHLPFNGMAYHSDGSTYAVPDGEYQFVVRVKEYSHEDKTGEFVLEKRVTLSWRN